MNTFFQYALIAVLTVLSMAGAKALIDRFSDPKPACLTVTFNNSQLVCIKHDYTVEVLKP